MDQLLSSVPPIIKPLPARGRPAEEPRLALRGADAAPGKQAYQEVEGATGVLPKRRLMSPHPLSLQGARPDGSVSLGRLDGGEQLVGVFDRRREIGLREENQFTPGVEYSAAHAEPLAAVGFVTQDSHGGEARRDLTQELGRTGSGTVVHHDP